MDAQMTEIDMEGAGLDGVVTERRDPAETDTFLPDGRSNGTAVGSDHRADSQRNGGEEHKFQLSNSVSRVREQLQEIVFWRVRLWMVIVFIFLLILAVIFISLALCSAVHSDEDEEFDPSLFKTPQYFNGSFKLLNFSSTESPVSLELQDKLASLFRSSPALGRYFSHAEVHAVRNDSVVFEYRLTFMLPEEHLEELRKFTLSREMVFNVFRQFLYDQDPVESGTTYVDPVSLEMFSVR